MEYSDFIERKTQFGSMSGFKPISMPNFLFDFQKALVEWSLQKGRAAIFADCGLGKSPIQLVWADNVVKKTNKPVLILTPLAVSYQTINEAKKFGIEAHRSYKGEAIKGIVVTNYEKLHFFDPKDFVGCVCDESSILKSFDGERRKQITDFMRKLPYRLLCTATAAPNDYIELGTSSEALGELGYTDMLTKFFKNDQNTISPMRYTGHGYPRSSSPPGRDHTDKWRFKGHAEIPFWCWVCSWARAIRHPSDLGFENNGFTLPPLIENSHLVSGMEPPDGMFFTPTAVGLREQRSETRRTIKERCELVSKIVSDKRPAIVWCHLNDEGDLLTDMIEDAKQISGKDSDEAKEEKFIAFVKGQIRVIVTKPRIGGWGLNFQHCNHQTLFPSHSFEQYYQCIRRSWRYGQKNQVDIDIVTTDGERSVLKNLQRKAKAADVMFDNLVKEMNQSITLESKSYNKSFEVPSWLK